MKTMNYRLGYLALASSLVLAAFHRRVPIPQLPPTPLPTPIAVAAAHYGEPFSMPISTPALSITP
ncbi:MAG: hypothetical protein HC804_06250 [Anaerolineae bacterium]|nr:hypothetical protein [Anaerolineae bacterium]